MKLFCQCDGDCHKPKMDEGRIIALIKKFFDDDPGIKAIKVAVGKIDPDNYRQHERFLSATAEKVIELMRDERYRPKWFISDIVREINLFQLEKK